MVKDSGAKGRKKSKKPVWREMLEVVIWAVILALLIRTFVVEAFYIPTGSMEPTLMPHDRVLVAKFIYYFVEPKRGDIVVFKFPLDTSTDFIKRIIGLPGDHIKIVEGKVYINGRLLKEPYVVHNDMFSMDEIVVPKGRYFVMGDNRPNSDDSRYWGYVPKENIKGKAFIIYWPITRIRILLSPY